MAKSYGAWEVVDERETDYTARLEVPGGWLYRTVEFNNHVDGPDAVALAFVPNPPPSNTGGGIG